MQTLGLATQVAERFYILRNGAVMHAGGGEEPLADHRAFTRYYL